MTFWNFNFWFFPFIVVAYLSDTVQKSTGEFSIKMLPFSLQFILQLNIFPLRSKTLRSVTVDFPRVFQIQFFTKICRGKKYFRRYFWIYDRELNKNTTFCALGKLSIRYNLREIWFLPDVVITFSKSLFPNVKKVLEYFEYIL